MSVELPDPFAWTEPDFLVWLNRADSPKSTSSMFAIYKTPVARMTAPLYTEAQMRAYGAACAKGSSLDAERYRWLRDELNVAQVADLWVNHGPGLYTDMAVDSLMASTGEAQSTQSEPDHDPCCKSCSCGGAQH